MNIRKKNKMSSEVSTHSLNDIMFFLLLFFLIASTMANPNVIKVMLPQAAGIQVMPKEKPVYITVNKEMEYFYEGKPISKDNLKTELEIRKGTSKDLNVVLSIDSKVEWQYVAELLDMGKELNIKMVAAARKK
jgi:biopolymer transport protein ExbD